MTKETLSEYAKLDSAPILTPLEQKMKGLIDIHERLIASYERQIGVQKTLIEAYEKRAVATDALEAGYVSQIKIMQELIDMLQKPQAGFWARFFA